MQIVYNLYFHNPTQYKKGLEAYYSINNDVNNELLKKYELLAKEYPNILFGGRLGQYKYFDMDDTIKEALNLIEKEINNG